MTSKVTEFLKLGGTQKFPPQKLAGREFFVLYRYLGSSKG